ncbi:GntR family transcriptional regulator [Streptomyces sp. NPDC048415]|uniref:GntR family transcriptional regulator n=1 Tax=Streptomyces sp. NPDC048415 TaxID=3154822 RepID=UPI0034193413
MEDERTGEGSGGKEFRRVLDVLRDRMANGTYALGSSLPAQRLLAEEFDVSRDTVQRVVRTLAGEGWVESRQGSGSRVIKTQRIQAAAPQGANPRSMRLVEIISEAFDKPQVTLDVCTLTSESLDTHVRLQAERIREKQIEPQRIAVRMLMPSRALDMPFPSNQAEPSDPRPVERLWNIAERHTASLRYVLDSLRVEKLVPEVSLQIHRVLLAPAFKLYLFNGSDALFAPYKLVQRPIILDSGEEIDAIDTLGVGADFTHYERSPDTGSPGSFFVDSMQTWFDSVWDHLPGQGV